MHPDQSSEASCCTDIHAPLHLTLREARPPQCKFGCSMTSQEQVQLNMVTYAKLHKRQSRAEGTAVVKNGAQNSGILKSSIASLASDWRDRVRRVSQQNHSWPVNFRTPHPADSGAQMMPSCNPDLSAMLRFLQASLIYSGPSVRFLSSKCWAAKPKKSRC